VAAAVVVVVVVETLTLEFVNHMQLIMSFSIHICHSLP